MEQVLLASRRVETDAKVAGMCQWIGCQIIEIKAFTLVYCQHTVVTLTDYQPISLSSSLITGWVCALQATAAGLKTQPLHSSNLNRLSLAEVVSLCLVDQGNQRADPKVAECAYIAFLT